MISTYADIARSAMTLPTAKRAQLAARLLKSLDHPSQKEIDKAWGVEIGRRVRELDQGKVKLLPGKQVLRRLWAGTRR